MVGAGALPLLPVSRAFGADDADGAELELLFRGGAPVLGRGATPGRRMRAAAGSVRQGVRGLPRPAPSSPQPGVRAMAHTGLQSLYALTRRRPFAEWVFEMNDWLLPMQQWEGLAEDLRGRFYDPKRPEFGPPHASSTGVYCDGLADAAALARAVGDSARAVSYERAVARGMRSLRQLQFRDERDAFYVSRDAQSPPPQPASTIHNPHSPNPSSRPRRGGDVRRLSRSSMPGSARTATRLGSPSRRRRDGRWKSGSGWGGGGRVVSRWTLPPLRARRCHPRR